MGEGIESCFGPNEGMGSGIIKFQREAKWKKKTNNQIDSPPSKCRDYVRQSLVYLLFLTKIMFGLIWMDPNIPNRYKIPPPSVLYTMMHFNSENQTSDEFDRSVRWLLRLPLSQTSDTECH
ncbi:hypothetical protein CEXT_264151 [Caerostris extrusa]|uniref:Uncharacterized protein n=1 Tax=Caerostris extrusa TaxID=172846 RepID=A0AAV4P9L2_CAEEX|nr:hypothetical protein CEXT_264151 [Caerostris extrusa]